MKITRAVIIFLLVNLSAVCSAATTAPRLTVGLSDVISTVEKSYRLLTDVSADFFQRSLLLENNREMRAEGEMFLKTASGNDPLMFRFDYFRPTTQEIVSNGETMWTYLHESRKVIVSDVSFVFNPFSFNPDRDKATNFLQGLGRFSKDFLTLFPSKNQDLEGNYILELTPQKPTAYIKKIFLVVSRDAVMNYARKRTELGHNPSQAEFELFLKEMKQREPGVATLGNKRHGNQAFPLLATTVIDHQGNSTTIEFSNIKTDTRLSNMLFDFSIPASVQVVKQPR